MQLSWKPQQQLAQSISVNAQMIQSIKVLQFNQEELSAFIAEQCERNPLIEMPGATRSAKSAPREKSPAPTENPPRQSGAAGGMVGSGRSAGPSGAGEYREIQDWAAAPMSLRDHLRTQLGSSFKDTLDAAIAVEVIESLDDDGYLRRPLHSIADLLGAAESQVETILLRVQHMDPVGVGARNLAECLTLQLREAGELTGPMERLLANLHLLGNHDYRQLSALCGVSVDEIVAMAARIKRLDPRPGLRFDFEPTVPAQADVTVELREDGSVVTELTARALPRILVNRQYYSELSATCRGTVEVKYVADCMRDANWLVRNLEQRAHTILKVSTEIMKRQHNFLRHGVAHLRPLNLKEVADAIGIHQSTVCRAISHKYVMTPRGLRELKFFFANSISAVDGGESVASDTVRHRIRQMIGGETAHSILSDDAIVKQLRNAGIDIARRTVAKYREAMHIPSSLQRRRQKQAQQIAPASQPEPLHAAI
ncbi:RNA polymerase factor sigma-54 [Devosia sp. A369]